MCFLLFIFYVRFFRFRGSLFALESFGSMWKFCLSNDEEKRSAKRPRRASPGLVQTELLSSTCLLNFRPSQIFTNVFVLPQLVKSSSVPLWAVSTLCLEIINKLSYGGKICAVIPWGSLIHWVMILFDCGTVKLNKHFVQRSKTFGCLFLVLESWLIYKYNAQTQTCQCQQIENRIEAFIFYFSWLNWHRLGCLSESNSPTKRQSSIQLIS